MLKCCEICKCCESVKQNIHGDCRDHTRSTLLWDALSAGLIFCDILRSRQVLPDGGVVVTIRYPLAKAPRDPKSQTRYSYRIDRNCKIRTTTMPFFPTQCSLHMLTRSYTCQAGTGPLEPVEAGYSGPTMLHGCWRVFSFFLSSLYTLFYIDVRRVMGWILPLTLVLTILMMTTRTRTTTTRRRRRRRTTTTRTTTTTFCCCGARSGKVVHKKRAGVVTARFAFQNAKQVVKKLTLRSTFGKSCWHNVRETVQ